jgi:hypothetical protein
MTAVNLLMADCAVPESRRSQVVKSRRHNTHSGARFYRYRQIGMALETNQPHFLPDQHPRIGRPVRLVTGRATFESYRSVFEGKRTALVAVAAEATSFIGREDLHHAGPEASVGIVAIYAGHGAFRQPVLVRLLKLAPDIGMTAGALSVDRGSFTCDQAERPVGMNLVAGRARNLILGVAALQTAHVRRLIQVTGQADSVRSHSCQLRGITDILG